MWIYVLKFKDQIFKVFEDFHAKVERKTGKLLKCTHTDNDGEYSSKIFKDIASNMAYDTKNISHTPLHNGVAERLNRTIFERV